MALALIPFVLVLSEAQAAVLVQPAQVGRADLGGVGSVHSSASLQVPSATGPHEICWLVSDGADALTAYDRVTMTESVIGPLGAADIEGIALEPSTGVLFGSDARTLGVIDTTSGAFTAIGVIGAGLGPMGAIAFTDVDGLAFDPTTGILWGAQFLDGDNVLLQIDPLTGSRVAGAFGGDDYLEIADIAHIDDIAIVPAGGIMYAADSPDAPDTLWTIDTVTGDASLVGGMGTTDMEGLSVGPDGSLLGTNGRPGKLYAIEETTGDATLLADLGGFAGVSGAYDDYEGIACGVKPPVQPTVTSTPTAVATSTPVVTATTTPEPTQTSTPVIPATATPVITATATPVITATATPVITATATPTPPAITATPATPTATITATPVTGTPTPDTTPTSTPVITITATPTAPTATTTPVITITATPTAPTATTTPVITATGTPNPTTTATVTPSPATTPTITATPATPTSTITATATPTPGTTPTSTPNPTTSATTTPTITATPTPTTSTTTTTPVTTTTSTPTTSTTTNTPATTATSTPNPTTTATTTPASTATTTPSPATTPTSTPNATTTPTTTPSITVTPGPATTPTSTPNPTTTPTTTPATSRTPSPAATPISPPYPPIDPTGDGLLRLVKVVVNDDGGIGVAGNWVLSAVSQGRDGSRDFAVRSGGAGFVPVFSGVAYELTESLGVGGYTSEGWACEGGTLDGSVVKVGANERVTCTITNNDDGGHNVCWTYWWICAPPPVAAFFLLPWWRGESPVLAVTLAPGLKASATQIAITPSIQAPREPDKQWREYDNPDT